MEIKKQKISNIWQAIIWLNISCLASGVMVNMVRHVSENLTSPEIIFFRNIFAFLMFIPIIFYKGFAYFKTNRVKLHIFRSTTGVISMLAFFHAISKMNLSIVTALSFTAPIFTGILAYFIFNEKMGAHRKIGMILGFMGMLIVIRPGFEGYNPISLLVLFSAVFWAISGIVIKTLLSTEKPIVITFYMTFFMTFFSAPLAFMSWIEPSNEDLLWVFGIALISNILQYTLAKGLSMVDITFSIPIDFTRLIYTAIIAYFAFGEKLDIPAAVGSIIIIFGAVYSGYKERKSHKLNEIVTQREQIL